LGTNPVTILGGMDPLQPLTSANFRVIIGGVEVGISSVTGLSSETDTSTEQKNGVPILRNVVLRRAVDGSKQFWAWRQMAVHGRDDRRDVVLEHLDDLGERVVNAWTLHEAWPCRWSGPAFDSMVGGIAMEEIELSYRLLTWDHPPDPETERTPDARSS
jgi:phage tail-like protein